MPSDIRSFFAPKSGGTPKAAVASQETKKTPAVKEKEVKETRKAAAAKKRRVVDSDDDEDDEPAPPQKTPVQKVTKKAPTPKKEEKVEASSYFSSTGKNKVSRTVPVREARPKRVVAPLPKEENYLDDDDAADDIYAEAFQKKDDDEYKEEPLDDDEEMDDFVALDEDEEEDVKPKRRAAAAKPAAKVSKSPVKPAAAAKPVAKSPAKTTRRRKPASSEEDEDDDFEEAPPAKKKASPAKKPPAKKPRTPAKKKEEDAAPSEVQALHDAIPTIRAPTPPPRDPSKKFNFYAQAAKPPPVAQGSKVVPTGADNCLAGLTFVFTGILESLSREDGQQLVKKYGGKVTTAPSKKTSYVVLGSEAGPKKLETIHNLGLKTINEDGLFMLIKTLPPNGGDGKAAKEWEAKKALEEKKIKEMAAEMEKAAKADAKASAAKGVVSKDESQLWTSKYAPARMAEICGNKGQVEKLQRWLQNWARNHKTGFKMRGADGSGVHRAVMIHGPPGIGKTTAAHLVAKLEGYDVLEYNASDTRSKKLMEETMRGVLDNKSLMGYFAADKEKVTKSKEKLLLVMDEVDGMSAGDRGGVGQLAAFCRKTSVPIICICNERKLPKMKPFDNVTFDLGFRRPDATAIRSRIASIAFREGMKLPANVIDQLVEGTRADIRQIINMLSTYKTTATTMSFDESKDFTKAWEKHVVFKPWDIASKLLGTEMFGNTSRKTLNDKIELYFNDHEFSYLMVQENYLKQNPDRASGTVGRQRQLKILELADEAAMSISDGDLCDALIHGTQQHWSLMPVHGMFSTVMPASKMYGSYGGGQMSFTSWLGNNSKQGKLARLVKEIQSHIRLTSSADRHEVRQSYIPSFFNTLIRRLEVEGKDSIPDIIKTMDDYFLTREDWDAIMELGLGPCDEKTVNIPTATKTAFTKAYNAMSHPMPFMKASSVASASALRAGKSEKPDLEDAIIESEDEGDQEAELKKLEEEETDLTKDKYVKQPKKKAVPKKPAAAKGKRKKMDEEDEDSEEEEKPKKKAAAKPRAPAKPRAKKA